jgi:hypothetical protein
MLPLNAIATFHGGNTKSTLHSFKMLPTVPSIEVDVADAFAVRHVHGMPQSTPNRMEGITIVIYFHLVCNQSLHNTRLLRVIRDYFGKLIT